MVGWQIEGMAAEEKAHGLGAYRRVLAAPLVLPLLSAQTVATLPAGMGTVALVQGDAALDLLASILGMNETLWQRKIGRGDAADVGVA